MTNIELPYFGRIDLIQINEYFYAETDYNGLKLRLDLNFEKKEISTEEAENIKELLSKISELDTQNKKEITKDFIAQGETEDYINFYFEEIGDEELNRIVDFECPDKTKEEQLLSKLKLIRVGLYPDGKYDVEYYGSFDYSIDIDGEACNQLLVVKTDKNGRLDHITWES